MSINRDMHCWQLSNIVIPVGFTRSFNFSISPKAGLLQDLKMTVASPEAMDQLYRAAVDSVWAARSKG